MGGWSSQWHSLSWGQRAVGNANQSYWHVRRIEPNPSGLFPWDQENGSRNSSNGRRKKRPNFLQVTDRREQILNAFNGPDDGAGVTTSGGTESILMACLAAREKAAAERGITNPEMYVSISVCVFD